ncbi:MAG: carboxypeptidase regulatory-like domain-containing protein, partial [Calditrichaeota bacterium]|nr:carboxypeptidase regulatory-like domain-containing protein [Calditrichota bacterium]
MKKLHNTFYHKLYLLPVVLFALGVFANPYAKSVKVDASLMADEIKSSQNNFELSKVDGTLELYKNSQQRFLQHVVEKIRFQEKLKSELLSRMTPGNLVSAFMRELNRVSVQKNSALKIRSVLSNLKKANVEDADGGIGGRVTVDGVAPVQSVQVLAFDDHGYFAGESDVNGDGNYTITGLNGGDYFVLTWSRDYVDEFYPDIQSPLGSFSGWRDAQPVKVFDAISEGINFDLQKGAVISGTIFKNDGTKIQDETVTFVVTIADDPRVVFTNRVVVADGRYELVVPQKGNVKISAAVTGFFPTWQENQVDWETAAIINIPDYESQVVDINFALQPDPAAAELGNITGRISPDQPSVYFVYPAVVAAYNAADTSLATWAIQVSPLLGYNLTSLEPGNYLVYANDYLGDVIGTDNFRGKFYDDDGNTLVSVSAGQTVENINIKLPAGATISGKVTDADGSPVDSLMLIALNANTSLNSDDPFLTQFELSITATNDQGEYVFTGLPDGEYVIRTFSDYYINFDLNDLDNILMTGKHAREIVDEYYNGVYNLLQWDYAQRIVVQKLVNVENINFHLAQARFFTGTVTDAQTGAPTRAVSLIAVNDTSAYPFWPFAKIEDNGEYSLGPLPQGKYKILALTGFGRDEGYLSEFYDGKLQFDEADVLNLSAGEMSNINFALKKGAVIEGFVDLAPGDAVHWAGKDTLDGIPVVAFEAETGKLASYDFVQFNGGYRIEKLFPGSYKVMTLPIPS